MAVAPFVPTFLSEPWPTAYDPLVFDASHFADGLYRVLVMMANSHKEVHKTADFETFTLVHADWLPGVPSNGSNTFQDHVVLPDGTFALYQNDNGEGATAVWTGTAADIDAGTVTRLGRVITGGGDCGTFYEAATGLVHIFTEDPDTPFGNVSSARLLHFTTPASDLFDVTQHADAMDSGGTWGTGDPCFVEAFGCYWMFCDYTVNHPTYWIALYRSDDLYTWELVDEKFTAEDGTRAGDFDIVDLGTHLIALSEYTGVGGGDIGVGVWRLDKFPARTFQPVRTAARLTVGGSAKSVRAWPHHA